MDRGAAAGGVVAVLDFFAAEAAFADVAAPRGLAADELVFGALARADGAAARTERFGVDAALVADDGLDVFVPRFAFAPALPAAARLPPSRVGRPFGLGFLVLARRDDAARRSFVAEAPARARADLDDFRGTFAMPSPVVN